jgi:2-iminoacetate synthase
MSVADIFSLYRNFPYKDFIANVDSTQVESVLQQRKLSVKDILILLSDAALNHLEQIAQKAADLTRQHFGSAISLFTPLYISNHCENNCVYCSFAKHRSIIRKQLTFDEIRKEAIAISNTGIRHILVLTGEAPNTTGFDYIKRSLEIISDYFSVIAIEMYPLKEAEYKELITTGCMDSLTIYQETYNEELYQKLHGNGPKANYHYRLEAPDRAGRQKVRAITIGTLLGLDDFRKEAFHTALHAQYLQKTYPEVELSISFPRICPQEGDFVPQHSVYDRQLVQLVTAFRLLFPTVGITISTRESSQFRDGIVPLGVTKVSAGVSTAVGGYSNKPSTTQFEIADLRTVSEMKTDLLELGFQPVMHDWNQRLSLV